MKLSFWVIDLALLALSAWLVAGLLDSYAAHTLWQHDGGRRQILAQAGTTADDATCTWLREHHVP